MARQHRVALATVLGAAWKCCDLFGCCGRPCKQSQEVSTVATNCRCCCCGTPKEKMYYDTILLYCIVQESPTVHDVWHAIDLAPSAVSLSTTVDHVLSGCCFFMKEMKSTTIDWLMWKRMNPRFFLVAVYKYHAPGALLLHRWSLAATRLLCDPCRIKLAKNCT